MLAELANRGAAGDQRPVSAGRVPLDASCLLGSLATTGMSSGLTLGLRGTTEIRSKSAGNIAALAG